jgi:pilus assembly protein CpaF
MGSGKTTLLNLLISLLDKHTAIGVIENRHELDVSVMYPHLNVIETQYSEGYGPSDLIEIFLRFNRDIIMFGEVRSPEEAEAMIDAKTKQSRGSIATSHSRDARRYLHNMRKLLMRTGNYSTYREAQYDVADSDDLIIQIRLDMKTGKRYVQRIVELVANDDMTYEIRDLFVYNKISNKIMINPKGVSKNTLEDCLEYELEMEDVKELKELFHIKPYEEETYEYLIQEEKDYEFDDFVS